MRVAAQSRLFTFALIFALGVFGVGQAFFIAFHIEMDGFRSLPRSLLTLLCAMLHGYEVRRSISKNVHDDDISAKPTALLKPVV
jgi:small neutral amino acid transporter SnatA (MarC family)